MKSGNNPVTLKLPYSPASVPANTTTTIAQPIQTPTTTLPPTHPPPNHRSRLTHRRTRNTQPQQPDWMEESGSETDRTAKLQYRQQQQQLTQTAMRKSIITSSSSNSRRWRWHCTTRERQNRTWHSKMTWPFVKTIRYNKKPDCTRCNNSAGNGTGSLGQRASIGHLEKGGGSIALAYGWRGGVMAVKGKGVFIN